MSKQHILVVDDEPDIRALVREILEDEGYEVTVAENAAEARAARKARRPDLTLLDIWLPDGDGIALLREWSEGGDLDSPVVMITGHGTVETALEATRLGAYDFLEKPLSTAKLTVTVRRALEAASLRRENLGLRRLSGSVTEPVGSSRVMQALREQVQRVAGHDTPVLLHGESGTGKEVLARYLHEFSPRSGGPFVNVSVAGLARMNPDAELFGTEDESGVSFGVLEQAQGGTLFLKDVADLDLPVQARLLSVLETRALVRVGGRTPVPIDVRVVAATRQDLAAAVAEGRFRDDLYYHLNVLPIAVPPLREHPEDIPELVDYYLEAFARDEGLPRRRFTQAALARLRAHDWPGNVRELKNLVQRLLILGREPEIDLAEVNLALGGAPQPSAEVAAGFDLPLREARERFERSYLEFQLQAAAGSVTRVAERIGMERTHLYRKLRALGIDPRAIRRAARARR